MAAGARLLAEDDNVGDATNKLLLDLDETAAMLGLKRQTLARMSRRGLIPRVKLGRLVKYPVSLALTARSVIRSTSCAGERRKVGRQDVKRTVGSSYGAVK